MSLAFAQNQRQTQRQTLSPQMRQSLRLLEMDIWELRQELNRELVENPIVENSPAVAERSLETELGDTGENRHEQGGADRDQAEAIDWYSNAVGDGAWDDYGADAKNYSADEDALARRERFFETRTRPETLAEHLLSQVGTADFTPEERKIAEHLIGSFDSDGRFTGAFADLVMYTGASEEKLREILAKIQTFDPPGCGATSTRECLLAQLDKVTPGFEDDVRELITDHFEDLANRDFEKIEREMGMSHERLQDAIGELKTLEPHPGRAFAEPGSHAVYVKAEIRAVKENGRFVAHVDGQETPRIRFSKEYLRLLEDPSTDAETKDYIRGKIKAIKDIVDAISRRYETIRAIAQAIFDEQREALESGFGHLKPMTMKHIAEIAKVDVSTVSRTVNGKYVSTPSGVVPLRRFFIEGIANAQGEVVAKSEVLELLAKTIEGEDPSKPLSDERIAAILKEAGFDVARRTVAKYRLKLGIPGAKERGK